MINEKDYLKNYSDIRVGCTVTINDEQYSFGFLFDFESKAVEDARKDLLAVEMR